MEQSDYFMLHTEDRSNESSELQRLFPLQFLCNYMTEKYEELLSKELSSALQIHTILKEANETLPQLQAILDQHPEQSTDVSSSQSNDTNRNEMNQTIKALRQRLSQITAQLNHLENEQTLKSTAFEDMSNMLVQTEPLITRIVYKDALTNAYNRYFLAKNIDQFFLEAKEGVNLSAAFIDIDDFKFYNTNFGHEFGDEVLRTLNTLVTNCFYKDDRSYFIRLGGDEFLLINLEMEFTQFITMLDQIRKVVEKFIFLQGTDRIRISLSIGVANVIQDHIQNYRELTRVADQRLYVAKQQGKNMIVHNS